MPKAREFWFDPVTEVFSLNKPTFPIRTKDFPILIREVVPIDWKALWIKFYWRQRTIFYD